MPTERALRHEAQCGCGAAVAVRCALREGVYYSSCHECYRSVFVGVAPWTGPPPDNPDDPLYFRAPGGSAWRVEVLPCQHAAHWMVVRSKVHPGWAERVCCGCQETLEERPIDDLTAREVEELCGKA